MAYLFDTNIFSELRRRERVDPRALRVLDRIPADESFISVISLMEIEIGVLRMERRDAEQGRILRQWFESVRADYARGRTLPVDEDIAPRCAALHVPNQRGPYDALIAATAEQHGLSVVTRNASDFAGLSVPLLNPWDA